MLKNRRRNDDFEDISKQIKFFEFVAKSLILIIAVMLLYMFIYVTLGRALQG